MKHICTHIYVLLIIQAIFMTPHICVNRYELVKGLFSLSCLWFGWNSIYYITHCQVGIIIWQFHSLKFIIKVIIFNPLKPSFLSIMQSGRRTIKMDTMIFRASKQLVHSYQNSHYLMVNQYIVKFHKAPRLCLLLSSMQDILTALSGLI